MDEKQTHLRGLFNRLMNPVPQINNSRLYAGSAMYFYCQLCGYQSDKLPEEYVGLPKKHCEACLALKAHYPDVAEALLKDMARCLPPVEIPE